MILFLLSSALAIDIKQWGVGPTVGTMAIPGKYPVALPAAVQLEDGTTAVDKTRADVEFGVHAVLYPGTAGRLFGNATVGLGTSRWFRPELVIGYDAALIRDGGFQLLAGLGTGAGAERFNDPETENFLRVNYFPVRANLAAMLRDKSRAYELGIWGAWHLVASQEYCDASGQQCVPGKGDASVAGALYLSLGAQATLYFGDFRDKGGGSGGKKGKE